MIREIEIRHTLLCVARQGGTYRLLMFADMDEERARRLAHEYGYEEGDIRWVTHEMLHYRRNVADELVWAVLDRLPYMQHRTPEQMLDAVRCIEPRTARIIRY